MNNTFQILLFWDKGSTLAERMSAKLLGLAGYADIDPQCPMGGPDGTKDMICRKDGKKIVVGCYFPAGQKDLKAIAEKFSDDYEGVAKHQADGFVFVTNQKITPAERTGLVSRHPSSEIFHGERVGGILDSPAGYGVRLEYLGIELTKAEQISFLNSHLDLKEQFEQIKDSLDVIKRATVRLEGLIEARDVVDNPTLSVLPVAGIQMSSRMSSEDLQALYLACMYESGEARHAVGSGFRKIQVWIGVPGCSERDADFIPPSPSEVPSLINELLEWWRNAYMDVLYDDDQAKVRAIAEFHERLLSIHPFVEGNGRLARVIASIQYRDLLRQEVAFDEIQDLAVYYAALRTARDAGHQALVDLFLSLAR